MLEGGGGMWQRSGLELGSRVRLHLRKTGGEGVRVRAGVRSRREKTEGTGQQ